LLMPDGRMETLPGHNDCVLGLRSRAVRGNRTPETDLIALDPALLEAQAHWTQVDRVRRLRFGPCQWITVL
jgi:hypothetical protein